MSRAASARSVGVARGSVGAGDALGSDYLEVSRRPWPSLVFLLPLIVAYELGTAMFARDAMSGTETRIIAFMFVAKFLSFFGATARYLPAAAVVIILLALHVAHRDRWRFRPGVLAGMAAESVCWTVPLLGLAVVCARWIPLQSGTAGGEMSTAGLIVLSIGAGVYEELVFRLIAFAVCSLVLTDVLGMERIKAGVMIVVGTSVAFSLYHYLGSEDPHWRSFVFRAVAGAFFGALYLWRGFGVTAGAHAAYDVAVQVIA